MSNLVDIGIRPSNIFRVLNAMNHVESCEEVSPQKVMILLVKIAITLAMSLLRSSNISKRKLSPIQNFSLQVKLIMRAHLEAFFGLMEELFPRI